MDYKVVLEVIVASIIIGIYFVYCGCRCFDVKFNKKIKFISFVITFILFITANYLILENFTRVVTTYIVVLFSYKYLFKKNIAQCAILSLVSYLFLVIGELIFTLIITVLESADVVNNVINYTGSIVANLFVCVVAVIMFNIFRKIINTIVTKVKENNKFTMAFTFLNVMTVIGLFLFKMASSNWKLNYTLLLNIVLTACLVYIGLIIIKQHMDKVKINDDYEDYVKYSKDSEDLVEQYSISQHENKNELIIIRSMVHKNNTKLLEYLDEIISSKDNIKSSWIKSLKYIPFGGLKGIFHNKISMMKNEGINVFLNISKEIGKSKLKDLSMKENNQLSKIIGVFLDNAKEASILSLEKRVSICVFMEDDKIIFEISNTFKDTVNIDKIYNLGHSTKGKNRGYGLSLVKTIIDENLMFENESEIKENYFVQTLKVNK